MVYTFAQLSPRILASEELPAKAVALNISKSVEAFAGHILTPEWVMAFVQRSWRISEQESADADLIFAVYYDHAKECPLILGAFRFGRKHASEHGDYFIQSPYPHEDRGRRIFLAEPASANEWSRYVGHYLPLNGKQGQNPIRYYETN